MAARSIVITGSNRGLGLELIKQLVKFPEPPSVIFAAVKDPDDDDTSELHSLAESSTKTKVRICKLDVTNEGNIKKLVSTVTDDVGKSGLNLLINTAGVYAMGHDGFKDQTVDGLMKHFHVNAIAPLMITRAFVPLFKSAITTPVQQPRLSALRAGVVILGTKMASISENTKGGAYQYRMSKAAAHMAARNMALEFGPQGILVLLLHPGVRAVKGGPKGLVSMNASASGILTQISKLGGDDAGLCYDYAGRRIEP